MNYWVVIDRQKFGPLTLDEVRRLPLREDSYVWHSGLPSWVRASEVPEFSDMFQKPQPEQPEEPVAFPEPEVSTRPLPPPPPPAYRPQTPLLPPKPPTYLGWSIASIICCCLIFGVIAVVYSSKVTPLYERGDYEGARKASERAELWLIIAITAGIVIFPFQVILSMI